MLLLRNWNKQIWSWDCQNNVYYFYLKNYGPGAWTWKSGCTVKEIQHQRSASHWWLWRELLFSRVKMRACWRNESVVLFSISYYWFRCLTLHLESRCRLMCEGIVVDIAYICCVNYVLWMLPMQISWILCLNLWTVAVSHITNYSCSHVTLRGIRN